MGSSGSTTSVKSKKDWTVTDKSFYDQYKPIRNKLRRYFPESVLKACIERMNQFSLKSVDGMMAMPWLWIVLLKWSLIESSRENKSHKKITRQELADLQWPLVKLSNHTRLPTQYQPLELYVRAITYQQNQYQRLVSVNGLARQELIFGESQDNDFFKTEFFAKHGIRLNRFLRISAFLISILEIKNKANFNTFDLPVGIFGAAEIDDFLSTISIDIDEIGPTLEKLSPAPRKYTEFFEQTPFLSFPIVKIGSEYWCINRKVLSQCLDYFVYDTLKEADKFSDKFGKRFENYVGKIIEMTGVAFRRESELKRELGDGSKLVDFLIHSGDANIFIDAKGVDLAARAKVTHLSEVLKGAIKSSLLKAIHQGQEVKKNLERINVCEWIIQSPANNYLFVVTYKPLYIGNAGLLDHLIDGEVSRTISEYPSNTRIPLENIYFFSIDEFESLMHLVEKGKISIVEAIERAKEADASFETAKYYFSAHLSEWPEYQELESFPLEWKASAMLEEFSRE
jgi:hypothetical protein